MRLWPSMPVLAVLLALLSPVPSPAFDAETSQLLEESPYVYIASTRKDGNLGRPAEIWFHVWKGSVCVGTPPGSWRVKRIRAGRPAARIWVGRPDGPSFEATGSIVEDRAGKEALLEAFAKKYPDPWPRYEKPFRKGLLETGERSLVCYAPTS